MLAASVAAAQQDKLLLAPMIGGLDACLFEPKDLPYTFTRPAYIHLCLADAKSPAAVVEATLRTFTTAKAPAKDLELGYTFYIPLLKVFEAKDDVYAIDDRHLKRIVETIKGVDRPVVLYLFSNHFSAAAPLEVELAKDTDNVLHTKQGPLPVDQFGVVSVYPWSFVNVNNKITRYRADAVNKILDEVCKLPPEQQTKIKAVTLLGELHHMFPKFESGMGFSGNYLITDYSQHSVKGFRQFLSQKFTTIESLNTALKAEFVNFDAINPPSKDIRTDALKGYFDHIDATAHGVLPVSGWVARNARNLVKPPKILIYLNGELHGTVDVNFGRQDVMEAHPKMVSANVGWNYNLNYSKLPFGVHQLDMVLEDVDQTQQLLATRKIAIVDRKQSAPQPVAGKNLPEIKKPSTDLLFHVDHPKDLSSYYFNPLVVLWHEFRKQQVYDYLTYFEKIAKSKCIAPEKIYAHQILPFVNPDWDTTKFAVGDDLAVPSSLNLGISLYGESSYGESYFEWFNKTGRKAYGVTEFHPLKAMNAAELKAVFDKHRKNNGRFISFFAEAAGLYEQDVAGIKDEVKGANSGTDFTFSRRNKSAGSSVLFESVREILK
jgi:hypothetical protein